MKIQEVYNLADKLAPFALSAEYCGKYGHRDNSGILLDCGEEIKGILFSLDLSERAIWAAEKMGANCIFTHHPVIYMPIRSLTEREGRCVLACAKAHISLISAHLNLDAAPCGIDESLMQGLGGGSALSAMDNLTGGCYGRVYDAAEKSLGDFTADIKKTFRTERIVVYGDRPVKRVASFCGAGFDENSVRFALENGADTIVSSDGKHHVIAEAVERGLNVVLLTHYAAENYGFEKFYERMKRSIEVPCGFYTDDRLI